MLAVPGPFRRGVPTGRAPSDPTLQREQGMGGTLASPWHRGTRWGGPQEQSDKAQRSIGYRVTRDRGVLATPWHTGTQPFAGTGDKKWGTDPRNRATGDKDIPDKGPSGKGVTRDGGGARSCPWTEVTRVRGAWGTG